MNKALLAAAGAALLTGTAHAAVLVGWNFDGNSSNTNPEQATFVDTSVLTAGSNSASIGAGLAFPADTAGSTSWGIRGFAQVASAPSTIAASGTDYIELKLTPAAGNTVDFTSLTLSGKTRETIAQLATHYLQAYASTDDFASSTAVGSIFDLGPANSNTATFFSRSVDLSPLSAVSAGTTLTLRLYGVYTNNQATQNDFVVGFIGSAETGTYDIAINGVVPEPSVIGLAGLAGIALLRRRHS